MAIILESALLKEAEPRDTEILCHPAGFFVIPQVYYCHPAGFFVIPQVYYCHPAGFLLSSRVLFIVILSEAKDLLLRFDKKADSSSLRSSE
ncbi:MAG: hypothetical protein ACYC51_05705 [Thermoleophilia bacterium]